MSSRRLSGPIGVVVFVAAAIAASGQTLQGDLDGGINFTQVSAPVAAQLGSQPVAADPDDSLACFRPGEFSAAVSAAYSVENQTLTPDTYRLASFDVDPVVDASGTNFLVEVAMIRFADGSTYRHGSRQLASPAANSCGPVLPAADDPDGTTCDVDECAALLRLHVELSGAQADLDALMDPAGCAVEVLAEDTPGSGIFSPQATSGPVLAPWFQLTGAGIDIPILVRSETALEVRVACEATVVDGEEGFTIDPNTGLAVISTPEPIEVTAICGADMPVPVDVPVDRPAGSIQGMFDVSGHDVVNAVVFARDTPFSTTPPTFAAADSPVRDDPSSYWLLEDMHEGIYAIVGSAVVDAGDTLVRFPSTAGANGPTIVVPGETTDLDAFLVADPQAVEGHVTLLDLGATALNELQLEPLTSFWIGPHNNSRSSRAEAIGDSDLIPSAASGIHGYTKGRLIGSYNPVTGQGEFDYRMLLTGPSPDDGDIGGSEAKATAWDFRRFLLRLGTGADQNVQQVRVRPGIDLHYTYEPGGPTHFVPPQTMCFGQLEVEYRIDSDEGAIWHPELDLGGSIAAGAETAVPGANYSVGALVRGLPSTAADSGPQARAYATVPEGIQYTITPMIEFAPPSGGTQELELDPLELPGAGSLGCGDTHQACIFLTDGGDSTPLVISLDPGLPFCPAVGENLSISVDVESGGALVDFVTVAVDGDAPTPLCAPCGADPEDLTFALPSLAAGAHSVTIEAGSVNGCTAELDESFEVSDEPCIEVPDPSERQLAFVDNGDVRVMRLEDDQVHWVLTNLVNPGRLIYDADGEHLAIVQDGSVLVVDADDPGESVSFPGSYESVAFRPSDNRDIAFVEVQPGAGAHGMYRVKVWLQDAGVAVQSEELGLPPGWSVPPPEIAWSADGSRIMAAFIATKLGSPVERRLYAQEWTVDPSGMTLVYSPLFWDTTSGQVIRQLLRVAHLSSTNRGLLTDTGMWRYSETDITLNHPVVSGMGLAAFPNPPVPAIPFVAGTQLGLATDLGIVVEPLLPSGPKASGIDISATQRLIAVAFGNGNVIIYRFDVTGGTVTLVEDREYPAQAGPGIAFRPWSP